MTGRIDWNFVNGFSGWLSGIGTLLAVVVSLWLARRGDRTRLKVSVGIRKIFFQQKVYEKPDEAPDFLIIAVTNVGPRLVIIKGLLWKNRLVRRRYLYQMPGIAPLSAQIPARLEYGDEADFTIPLSAFAETNDPADLRGVIPRPRMLTIRFLRMLVRTATGEIVAVSVEKELRQWLLAFVEGKRVSHK